MKTPPKPRFIMRQSLSRKDFRTRHQKLRPLRYRQSGQNSVDMDFGEKDTSSSLKIYPQRDTTQLLFASDEHSRIAEKLNEVGVRFEKWQTEAELAPGAAQEDVIAAYQSDIDRLINEEGYQTVDVVSLDSSNPKKDELRQIFLSEHRHSEDEVRFFVAGEGLFSLHIEDKVYEVLCRQGDLISVPANTPHWFDMGPNPGFIAIRLFNNPEGWVANYTGDTIAERFNRLEN